MTRVFSSAVLLVGLAAGFVAGGSQAAGKQSNVVSLPHWLAPAEARVLERVFGGATPVRTYYLRYPRKIAVIFQFKQLVICGACSAPSNASLPRGRMIRLSFDRRTHLVRSADGLRFCEAHASYPPRSECLRR